MSFAIKSMLGFVGVRDVGLWIVNEGMLLKGDCSGSLVMFTGNVCLFGLIFSRVGL